MIEPLGRAIRYIKNKVNTTMYWLHTEDFELNRVEVYKKNCYPSSPSDSNHLFLDGEIRCSCVDCVSLFQTKKLQWRPIKRFV